MCECDLNAVSHYPNTHIASAQSARDFLIPIASKIGGPEEARLVDEFRFAINDLGGVIEDLRNRTHPVSRPDYAEPGCGPDTPPISAGRTELFRLHTLTGELRGIIDRLEV